MAFSGLVDLIGGGAVNKSDGAGAGTVNIISTYVKIANAGTQGRIATLRFQNKEATASDTITLSKDGVNDHWIIDGGDERVLTLSDDLGTNVFAKSGVTDPVYNAESAG